MYIWLVTDSEATYQLECLPLIFRLDGFVMFSIKKLKSVYKKHEKYKKAFL